LGESRSLGLQQSASLGKEFGAFLLSSRLGTRLHMSTGPCTYDPHKTSSVLFGFVMAKHCSHLLLPMGPAPGIERTRILCVQQVLLRVGPPAEHDGFDIVLFRAHLVIQQGIFILLSMNHGIMIPQLPYRGNNIAYAHAQDMDWESLKTQQQRHIRIQAMNQSFFILKPSYNAGVPKSTLIRHHSP
jgi:hypothetical protein